MSVTGPSVEPQVNDLPRCVRAVGTPHRPPRDPRRSSAVWTDPGDPHAPEQDGDTVVISGFLHDREKTTQGSGLAGFFGAQTRETLKSELVIMLTPVVVGPIGTSVAAAR